MLDRFRRHLVASGLIPEGARVVVGYSGGPDSTCLLHLLAQSGVDVIAAHLHHGQRPEADKEMQLCEAFCQELGIPFVSGKADVPRMASDLRIGLEEAGRRARYTFLNQAAFRLEAALIATAHTRSDHVETVLLNLARGSGLAGLGGIPERRQNVIRPLLPFTRDETRGYCEAHAFWTHDDPSNEDTSFSRARIRHRVLPELAHVNESVEANVARLAEIVREEDGFLDGMAAAALEQSESPLNGDLGFLTNDVEIAFARSMLTSLPAVLLKRAIRLAVEALGGQLDHRQTATCTQGIAFEESGSVTSDGGEVVVEWDGERIHVRKLSPTAPFRYTLTVPGETESEDFGWRFVAYESEGSSQPSRRQSLETAIDSAAVRGSLYFRTAAPGDRMKPLGFDGHRKIADLFAEAKLTQAARQRLPVVCDMIGPIWAPGVCLDDRVAIRGSATRATTLRFEPITSSSDPIRNPQSTLEGHN